jgi:hypothetical protein
MAGGAKFLDGGATVAELADAQDLGSCGVTREGSSPSGRIGKPCHPGQGAGTDLHHCG